MWLFWIHLYMCLPVSCASNLHFSMEVFSQVSYYTSFSRNSWDLSSSRANQKSKSVVSVGLEDNFCSDEAVGGSSTKRRWLYRRREDGLSPQSLWKVRGNQRIPIVKAQWISLQIPNPTCRLLLFPHRWPKFCIKDLVRLWIQLAV